MDWRAKIALVVVVVGVGLMLALQFRKSGGPSDASAVAASETAAANDPAGKGPAAQNTVPYRATSLDHLGDTTSANATASSSPAPSETTDTKSASTAGSGLVDLNAPEQTHKIVDGDTLPQLAQQYLGRADRYLEIYDYNRDVLHSPDVLPIGAELRIPSPLAKPLAVDTASVKSTAAPAAANTSAASAPLVPLISPTAQPVAQRTKPRTYRVQPGDNLVDIARKMYGDGRKHQDLYEANRGIMHNPGDLKPGMILVIP